jgi:hypothetical protein
MPHHIEIKFGRMSAAKVAPRSTGAAKTARRSTKGTQIVAAIDGHRLIVTMIGAPHSITGETPDAMSVLTIEEDHPEARVSEALTARHVATIVSEALVDRHVVMIVSGVLVARSGTMLHVGTAISVATGRGVMMLALAVFGATSAILVETTIPAEIPVPAANVRAGAAICEAASAATAGVGLAVSVVTVADVAISEAVWAVAIDEAGSVVSVAVVVKVATAADVAIHGVALAGAISNAVRRHTVEVQAARVATTSPRSTAIVATRAKAARSTNAPVVEAVRSTSAPVVEAVRSAAVRAGVRVVSGHVARVTRGDRSVTVRAVPPRLAIVLVVVAATNRVTRDLVAIMMAGATSGRKGAPLVRAVTTVRKDVPLDRAVERPEVATDVRAPMKAARVSAVVDHHVAARPGGDPPAHLVGAARVAGRRVHRPLADPAFATDAMTIRTGSMRGVRT